MTAEHWQRIRQMIAELDRTQPVGLWGTPQLLRVRRMIQAFDQLSEAECQELEAWQQEHLGQTDGTCDLTLLDWPGWEKYLER